MSTEVLHLPASADGQHFYHNSARRSSPIRRSSPSSSFLLERTALPSPTSRNPTPPMDHVQEWVPTKSAPATTVSIVTADATSTFSPSPSTYAPSEPPVVQAPTPDLDLPTYCDATSTAQPIGTSTPPGSPTADDECDDETPDVSATSDTTRSSSPLLTPTVVDDTAVQQHPSRQVDFLSHDWREEDIWSSWRHIVSQRKSIYGEKSRLENASWRTWAKSKYRLPTVSPEKLNWLKESDVTWLYGPLKVASSYPITQKTSPPSYKLSQSNSFIHKKPILKKRSASEVMLQKSISTSSLLKQAAASIQAQGRSSRKMSQASDAVDSKFGSETPSRSEFDYFTSTSNSTASTPFSQERRHIRFDDRVEQCIAVDCKDGGLDFGDDDHDLHFDDDSDSGSDDGLVMKPTKRSSISSRRSSTGSRRSSLGGPKTIETLPATTLKYRTDSPDIPEDAQQHTFARLWSTGKLSPSASQETLRPANPSSNYLLSDRDDEDMDSDSSWSFGAGNPKSSLGASGRWNHDEDLPGMRRTGSGMFMPYDQEDELVAQGLFGRVSETINTARDIAHVIWNVGWRK